MQKLIFRVVCCLLLSIFLSLGLSAADTTSVQVVVQEQLIDAAPAESSATADTLATNKDESVTDNALKKTIESIPSVELHEMFSFAKFFWAAVFFLIGYFIIRFIGKSIEAWSEKNAERRIRGKAILPVVKIICWLIISYIVIRGIFNPPAGSLIAFGASIGVAVGFAAQDLLKNIFGGFVILIDRPFKVGDKIEVGSVYGEVLDMSLRSTRIQTADDSLVTLPNGELLNQPISNANSGESNCQVVAEIYLPITIDTVKVRQIAIEAAQTSRFVYLAKPIAVLFFNEIKHDKLCYKMRLKAYVMDIRYEFLFKSEMTEIVISDLLKAGLLDPSISI